jgi:hypothetical protein
LRTLMGTEVGCCVPTGGSGQIQCIAIKPILDVQRNTVQIFLFRNYFVILDLEYLILCAAMSLLNGTARAALKRGIANDEIGRPKSLCICARCQRSVVESSFCEMRTWLVLRSRCQPLHSGRLWRLRSSSATAETASGRVRITPSPMERRPTIGCARRPEHSA